MSILKKTFFLFCVLLLCTPDSSIAAQQEPDCENTLINVLPSLFALNLDRVISVACEGDPMNPAYIKLKKDSTLCTALKDLSAQLNVAPENLFLYWQQQEPGQVKHLPVEQIRHLWPVVERRTATGSKWLQLSIDFEKEILKKKERANSPHSAARLFWAPLDPDNGRTRQHYINLLQDEEQKD